MDTAKVNTDPPKARCPFPRCGGRFRPVGSTRQVQCRKCRIYSYDHRRTGWWWRVRLWVGR